MTIVGSDIPTGKQTNWYMFPGEVVIQQGTGASFTLTGTAEYGSPVVSVNGVAVPHTETGTETGGTTAVSFTNAGGDPAECKWFPKANVAQVAASMDVSVNATSDKLTDSIHGQATKIVMVGQTEHSGTFQEFVYNEILMGAAFGLLTDTPEAGSYKVGTAYGTKKIGGLVGKQNDQDGVLTRKFFLAGVQFEGLTFTFERASWYKRTVNFTCDWYSEVTLG